MFTFIAENASGEQFQLTQNPNYDIEITSGLLPPSATINTSTLVNVDGGKFNSSQINMRNLVLMIYPKVPVESNRIALYKIFRSKQYVKCYYENSLRSAYIEGYVENIDGSLFDQTQAIQVSIICPQPFWLGFDAVTEISKVTSMFEFPFSIDFRGIPFSEYNPYHIGLVLNNGDVESGIVIDICFTGSCTIENFKIYNADTGEFFGLTGSLIGEEGIIYRIDTVNNTAFAIADDEVPEGVDTNLLNYIAENSTWLMARNGQNMFYYTDDSGTDDVYLKISFTEKFEGV